MSISALFRVLWRQRKFVIPVAMLALGACGAVFAFTAPTYRASAAVVLLNPPALPEVTDRNPTIPPQFQNPYVRFGDLTVIVDILVRIVEGEPIVDKLKAAGLEGTFEVAANRDFYRGPIVDVAAESPSEEGAIANTNLVIEELRGQLDELQRAQGTDENYFIKSEIIVTADKATRVLTGTLRLLLLVAALGGALTISAGFLADVLQRRRQRYHAQFLEDLV